MDGNTQRTGCRTHAATAHSRRQRLSSEGRRVLVCKLSQGPLPSVREPQPSAPEKSRGRENSISVGIFRTRQPLKRVPLAKGLRERSLQYKSACRQRNRSTGGTYASGLCPEGKGVEGGTRRRRRGRASTSSPPPPPPTQDGRMDVNERAVSRRRR